ncbi:alpha/beta hydrolase [Ferrimonas balearica]|uniref:alpha/beta hydrolase n=1 Tax=Ferrimonas balearica TaxID=44012 RepID=UPI001C997514|nr:hypothetical protein [Ferrimonas balearica]MBY5923128.1 hypothetical protein [Ferrimonas balearica]MBY5997496.1 hypothetical protein [Ferrimonas balearica]
MKEALISWLAMAAVVYIGLCLMLTLNQRRLIYYPSAPVTAPEEQRRITTPSGEMVVEVANPGQAHAVFYFGGNAESVIYGKAALARSLPGCTLYLVNYPGYGGSEGTPEESAIHSAALAIYDALAPGHQTASAIGRSLGGSVAIQLAHQRPLSRLALLTPFDSMVALARHHYPFFPVSWLLRERYEIVPMASALHLPTLVVLAEADRVVPRARSEALIEVLDEPQVVILPGNHNRLAPNASLAAFFSPLCGAL